jgi:hypothetical protein
VSPNGKNESPLLSSPKRNRVTQILEGKKRPDIELYNKKNTFEK